MGEVGLRSISTLLLIALLLPLFLPALLPEVYAQNIVEIVSYNAPSTASPGQTVSVQLTIRYSFSSTSYVGVTISRQLPDGSWERVWYNPDYQTQRSGQGTLSYTATFSVPNQPDTYRYRIRAQYWDGSRWITTDEKYFNIQVQQQQSYLRVRLDSATLNGQSLSTSNPELRVNPGSRISGIVTITVENVQPGSWITPVIWVTSWERGTVSNGRVRVIADDIRSTRQFTVSIDVTAPSNPGTYYIGFFAGWMYNADEVASNDHPPNYGDGDDVWDMPAQGWEEVIRNGQASTGPYRMPGRAIRIVVQQPQEFRVEIVSYNAPSTASPGQTVSVQITIRYSFSSTSQVGVAVGRQLPDGSWERVWYNPDYRTQRSGQGTLSYTATFSVPNQPGTYRYVISAQYAQYEDGGRWIETDRRYFDIQVQQQQQLSVDVWTNKGGQGRGNLNGGQYTIGESITFYCSVNLNVDSLRIKVIRPDGVEVIALDRGPSSAGTYQASGTVGEPAGERRVICEARSGGQTSSDEVRFTVTQPPDTIPPTVRVIAPNGGETLFPGNVFRIRWEASDNVGVAKVHIWLFQGNEQVMVIARDLPNTGYYDWTVPNRPGTNYRIRIAAVDAAGNAGYDDSDGTFEIGGEVRVTAQIVSLTTDKNQYNPRETVRIRYTIRNTGDVRIELRMVVEIVDPSGRSVYDSHRVDQDRRHDLDPGQTASGEFTWTIPADAVPGTYEVRASLRHWNIWDKIFDYRWGDRPGPRFTVQAGVQGTLQHFDLDYHGTPPNSDGNDQTTVTVSPCSRLTLFFYYREGNAGNNYIIRVYAEWDKNNFIANSDNNEAGPESDGREIGGFRWDVETYTVPCTPGTYKVRVVYRASTTPPTWDSYDRLLAEGTVIVQEAATATLQVGIRHTYIGDLKIWVGVEGGREVLIWNREGGGTRDLFREWNLLQLGFTVNDLPPSESKRWYLRIRDEAGGDEGRLEYFRIIYQGRTYESQDRPEIKDFQEVRAWIPSRGAPSLPDLTVRNVNFSPQSVSQGGSITVSWTEVNIGSGNAGPYRVGIYLGVSEYGRDHLLGSFNRDGLVAGGSRSYTQTFTIPSSVPPGSYYVTVFIDDLRVVSEANEDNNVGSSTPNRLSVGESVLLFLEINMPWAEGRGQTTARGEVIGGITLVGPREIRVGQTYEYKLYISVGQGPTTGINYYIYGTREKPGVATIFIPEELDWQFNPHRDFSYPGISWQSGTLDWLRRYIGWAIAEIITLMVEALKGSWAGLLASLGIFIIGALIPDSTQATYDVRFGEAIEAPNNDPARSDAITVTWIEQGNTQGPIVIIIHVTPSEYARGKEFKLGVAVDLWIGGWQRDLHYLITGNSYSIRVL